MKRTPGGFLCVNDDDDNGNGVADKDEPGFTTGENDLQALTVSIKPGMTGTVTLSVTAGVAKIKLYENPDRSNPVTLPKSWTVPTQDLPKTFYVEGKAPGAAVRDVELKAKFTGDRGPCEDIVKLTVLQVDLDVDSNNDGTITDADDNIEDQDSGKILCIDSPVEVPLKLSVKPTDAEGSVTLSATTAGAVAVFADPGLTIPITPPKTWTTVASMPTTVYLKGITPGLVTLKLKLADARACEDVLVLTVRPKWTADQFPQMTFTATNVIPQVDAQAPRIGIGPCPANCIVAFGDNPPDAVVWNSVVDVQSNGPHVSCNQFTVGVIQTMLSYVGTYTYEDGIRVISGTVPTLDQHATAGPGSFYKNSSTHVATACGSTGVLAYIDTPFVFGTWTNTCPGTSGALQSITFSDNLETWLVALHNPSGCYTTLKHFTWQQDAATTQVNVVNRSIVAITSTGASAVDNGPGGTPVLVPPNFNSTIGSQCQ